MNGMQWRFMAGAPMPAKPKAYPPPTNTITGNSKHKMDICLKIRIKDRIPHSNSHSFSAIFLFWSDMRPSCRRWAPRLPRPVGWRRDWKSSPHLLESPPSSDRDSVRGQKVNFLPSSFFGYAHYTSKRHSRLGKARWGESCELCTESLCGGRSCTSRPY